jgi:hypothetical protein
MNPTHNPLVEPTTIHTKRRLVKTGSGEDLVNPATSEIRGVFAIQ